ncbi:virion protein US2 [Equid herpesvirus 6]|uniref:Virion protein US2 n=1 Tax=Equid herpesvirus 6 TaxID=173566 RepID=A0A7S9VME0_9ALPH|nr:virion protein US2 [Equid herpesvirus 6]QPI70178.1 virion protein US2 [Equid herpesvirus 6]
MGVVLITVVTFVDKHGALPARSADVDGRLWEFLARQCFALAAEPLGIPVVVRSADLYQFSARLLTLPKSCRPIVRTGGPGAIVLKRNGVLYYEDGPETSTEWPSVISGFRHLNSGVMGNRPYHLWIFGAADLCRPAFDLLPGPKRIVYAELSEEWACASWQPPFGCGRQFPAVPWTAVGELARGSGATASPEVPAQVARLIYAVVDRTRPGELTPPVAPAHPPQGSGPFRRGPGPLRGVPRRGAPCAPGAPTPPGRDPYRLSDPKRDPPPAWAPKAPTPPATPTVSPTELPARGTQNPSATPEGGEGGAASRRSTWKTRLLRGGSRVPSAR